MNKKATIFLLVLLSLKSFNNSSELLQVSSYLSDEERLKAVIQIKSDNDFLALGFNGTGTDKDPYIIEDLVIQSQDKGGIYISDTTKSCTIQNCSIEAKQFGIYIEDSVDGKYLILDNFLNVTKLNKDGYGIFLNDINGAEVRNNTCTDSNDGITLFWADNVIIQKNNCSYNNRAGIDLSYVEYSLIDENNCFNNTFGITTFYCSFVNFTNNNCYFNGYSEQEDFNELWEYGDGIQIGYSNYCRVLNNNCTKNIRSGLSLPGGDFFVAYNNTIKHNRIGIEIQIDRSGHLVTEIVSGVAIVYNKLINNTEYGVYLSGYVRQSHIHHNIFIHNNIEGTSFGGYSQDPPYGYSQARENTRRKNTWFDKKSNEGNYWSDYQNEGDYLIDGNTYGSSNSDPYPIANFSDMNIPPIPTFPKGKWFSDRDFFLIRIAFSITGIILIPISLIVIPILIAKFRKKRIDISNVQN